MAGTLVKTIEASLIVNAGDAKEQLDDLTAQAEKLAKPWEIDFTAISEEAQASADDLTKALTDYQDAAREAEEASQQLADLQRDDAAGADELAAAQDRVTDATLRSLDAQLRLGAAELRAGAEASEAGDEQEVMGDKALTSGKKAEEGGTLFEGAWEKARLVLLGVVVGLGYGMVKAAGFQSQMTMLSTQAGVAKDQLGKLGTGVLNLAGQVGEDPDSLAQALYHIESSFQSVGITGPKALSLLRTAAEGARTGGADLVDVTNALDATIVSGVGGVKNYSQAMGALNAIVGSGDMTMEDLATAMGSGIMAVAKSFGQNIYQVGSALAVFGDNNIRGAKAATDLRMVMTYMVDPVDTAGAALKKLGLTSTTLGDEMEHHGLSSAVGLLLDRLKASHVPMDQWAQYTSDIFGKKAGVGLDILLDQFARLQSKFPDIEKGAAGFGSAWKQTQATVSQQMHDLEGASEALAIKLGEKLLPAGLKVVHWLTDFVQDLEEGKGPAVALATVLGAILAGVALEKLAGGLKTAEQGFEALWGLMGKGVSGVQYLGSSFGALWGKLTGLFAATEEQTVATEELTVAQTEADAAMDANPIGAIIALLVLLGVGIYEVVKHWKDFRQWGLDAFHAVEHAAEDAFDWVKGHWPLILEILLVPVTGGASLIIGQWHRITDGAEEAIHDVGSWFGRLPGMILSWVANFGTLLWDAGADLLRGLIHGVESEVGGVIHTVESVGSSILHGIEGALGIGSPSKEMRLRGQYAGQGLALGLTDSIPLVTAAAEKLATATLSGYQLHGGAGAAAGAAGLGEVVLTLNVNQQQLFEWMQQGLVRLKRGRGFQVDTRAGLGLA